MAIKITLKGTIGLGGSNTPDWYRQDTENLAGVTNLPSNSAIGLESIVVFPPSESQSENNMVCAVILKTIVGDVRGTVYQSKNAPDTIYLRPPQSKEELENGEVKWHDEVKLTSKIIAQTLRYVETLVDITDTSKTNQQSSGTSVEDRFNGIGQGDGASGENPFANAKTEPNPTNPFEGIEE